MWEGPPGATARVTDRIQAFRLGEFALIDVPDLAASRCSEMRSTLSAEWALSPSGLMVRVARLEGSDPATVGALAGFGSMVEHWPGTPMGIVAPSAAVHDLVAQHPSGRFLVTGQTIPAVLKQMWGAGVASTVTIELAPILRSVDGARSTVTMACLDWGLAKLIPKVSPVVGQLIARSVLEGAGDLHLSLSQHRARVRVLVEDDIPRASHGAWANGAGRGSRPTTLGEDLGARGEFDAGGRHFAWVVVEAQRPASAGVLPRNRRRDLVAHPGGPRVGHVDAGAGGADWAGPGWEPGCGDGG